MPIGKIEEGFFDSNTEQINSLSSCFAQAVKHVCAEIDKGGIVQACIARYVSEDPNGDVLGETKQLFHFASTKIPHNVISQLELEIALLRIQNYYFILLPGYTLKKHRGDLCRFFENISLYAAKRLRL